MSRLERAGPAAIAAWDANHAAIENTKRAETGDYRIGDRIELGDGYYAIHEIQPGSLKHLWRIYSPRGDWVANKGTAELCHKWYADNSVGWEANKRAAK